MYRQFQLPTRGINFRNQRKNLPFGRIILRNRKKKPQMEEKIAKIGSSTVGEEGYIRKLRSTRYLTGISRQVIFRIT